MRTRRGAAPAATSARLNLTPVRAESACNKNHHGVRYGSVMVPNKGQSGSSRSVMVPTGFRRSDRALNPP
jgi:hypothetical protein